jgi:hypothetical protein
MMSWTLETATECNMLSALSGKDDMEKDCGSLLVRTTSDASTAIADGQCEVNLLPADMQDAAEQSQDRQATSRVDKGRQVGNGFARPGCLLLDRTERGNSEPETSSDPAPATVQDLDIGSWPDEDSDYDDEPFVFTAEDGVAEAWALRAE